MSYTQPVRLDLFEPLTARSPAGEKREFIGIGGSARLTTEQEEWAAKLARRRSENCEAKDVPGDDAIPRTVEDRRRDRYQGAAAEILAAECLGMNYRALYDDTNGEDVGPVMVRSTYHKAGCLILKPGDRRRFGDRPWLLVTGTAPDMWIVGWIMGRDGWGLRRPPPPRCGRQQDAWIYQDDLRSVPDLCDRLEWRRGVWSFVDR